MPDDNDTQDDAVTDSGEHGTQPDADRSKQSPGAGDPKTDDVGSIDKGTSALGQKRGTEPDPSDSTPNN